MMDAPLKIDPNIIKQASILLSESLLNGDISIDYGKEIIFEHEVYEINLENLTSVVAGLTDPIGQIRDWITGVIREIWNGIKSALADLLAEVLKKLGEVAPEVARRIAEALREFSKGLADSINIVGAAISTQLISISGAISTLGVSIVNLGASISGAISMVATSLSTAILQVSYSISQSIVMLSASLSQAIVSVGAGISQTILMLSTSISQSILSIATSISASIVQVSAAISTGIAQVSSSISLAITQISGAIAGAVVQISGAIANSINMLGSSISKLILDVALSLSTGISMLSTSLAQAILAIGTSVNTVIAQFSATIIANFYLLIGRIDYATAIMGDYLSTVTNVMSEGFRKVSDALTTSMKEFSEALKDVYKDTIEEIKKAMEGFSESINNVMKESIKTITENMSTMTKTIIDNLTSFVDAIIETSNKVISTLIDNYERLSNSLLTTYTELSKAIRDTTTAFTEMLANNLGKISDALRESYEKSINAIIETGEKLRDYITETSKSLTDTILENLDKAIEKLRETIEAWASMLEYIGRTFEGFVNSILQLPERLDPTAQKHARYMWDEYWTKLYAEAGTDFREVYRKIPLLFKEGSPSPWDILLNSIRALEVGKVANFVIVPVTVPSNYVAITPGRTKEEIEKALRTPLFFSALGEFVSSAAAAIGGFFEANVLPVLSKIGQTIWDAVNSFFQTLVNLIKSAAEGLQQAIIGLAQGLASMLISAASGLAGGMGIPSSQGLSISASPEVVIVPTHMVKEKITTPHIAKPLYDFIIDLGFDAASKLGELMYGITGFFFDIFIERVKQRYPEIVGKVATREDIQKSLKNLFVANVAVANAPFMSQIFIRGLAHVIYQIGHAIYNSELLSRINLRPFGIGVDFSISLGKLFGGAISHFSRELKEYADTLGAGLTYGLCIWLSQPISKLASFFARNVFPVELPSVDNIMEMLRRAMPHEKFDEILAKGMYLLALYGYSDAIIDLMTLKADEYSIIVKDRFEKERKIPLSLMYALPSASDVARMMVRDIIIELEEFKKLFAARGMSEDVATLYYLLHFRYPPPEKLWSFVTRGISGLLWYAPSADEENMLRKEAEAVGAFMPQSAASLNFKGDLLLKAFSAYMKWHDYARFSYISGFTSDNQIYIDTLADIPTKIDQRWMVRFALYELLSQKGVTLSDPVKAFVTKVVESSPQGQIILDLTNFCRTLQATGLHPHYVPIVAVAETINSIADERTLLRTGVLNLYKEGFMTLDGVDALFAGTIITAFKVAYYDTETHRWGTGYINAPLRYLPMESKLMQLRAIMDRALDVLRDVQRDILTAYQEYIIETYDEFKKKFSEVISKINNIYVEEYRKVVGKYPSEEMQLKFVESYYKPYTEALSIWRDVHVIRRIRAWTMRWIGWLMYRIAYGVITPDEISNLIEYLRKNAKLTDSEKQFLEEVVKLMAALSVREYIPTPMQLATMAEYISIPEDIVTKVFDARGVPQEFRGIWQSYISIRPIADDVKGVITAYRRALLYATKERPIPQELVDKVKKAMQAIGFTSTEEEYLGLRVALEEFVMNAREYIPTPSTLATLAEYVPLPKEMVEKAMALRRVPPEWAALWMRYIDIRPIADDIRGLITTLFRAMEYVAEAKDYLPTVESYARLAGFDDREIAIFRLRAQLEELIYKSREYTPTPMTLASIAEILPEARYYFDDVVKRLRISPEWASLWAKYVDLRPLVDDVKRMLSRAEDLFCSFMITEEAFMAVLKSVQSLLGYTDKEIEFLLYTTKLRRHQVAWKEIIGDVDRMVMLSEYSPTAREFALGTLYKMIDSLNIDDATKALLKKMWEDFIRIRPVIDEVRKYVTDLINAYVDGTITQQILESELEALKEWGLDDYEIQFYKAIAALRRARKLKIQFY